MNIYYHASKDIALQSEPPPRRANVRLSRKVIGSVILPQSERWDMQNMDRGLASFVGEG